MNIEALIVDAVYVTALTAIYLLLRHKYVEDMVKKQIITTAGGKELRALLKAWYSILVIVGSLMVLVDVKSIVYLILVLIVTFTFVSHDVIKSLFYYYTIILSKMITQGDFVIMTRGIRGWVKRLTPFYVELHGEHGEVIRVPNYLAASEPVRLPSKALPLSLVIKVSNLKETKVEEIRKMIEDAVTYTKRYSVIPARVKIRAAGSDFAEFEVVYGLNNYEAANIIIELLDSKLVRPLTENGIRVEVRREHSIMGKL